MNAHVFLEVFRINESRRASLALVRSLAGMSGFYVIIKQSSSLEPFAAIVALVPLVVVVGRAFVGLKIRSLTERCSAELALIRLFAGVRPLVIANLGLSRESLAAHSTYVRLVTGVNNVVNLEIVRGAECLAALMAHVLLYAVVSSFVLIEILLAQK